MIMKMMIMLMVNDDNDDDTDDDDDYYDNDNNRYNHIISYCFQGLFEMFSSCFAFVLNYTRGKKES